MKFGRNVVKEETTQKTTKVRTKSPQFFNVAVTSRCNQCKLSLFFYILRASAKLFRQIFFLLFFLIHRMSMSFLWCKASSSKPSFSLILRTLIEMYQGPSLFILRRVQSISQGSLPMYLFFDETYAAEFVFEEFSCSSEILLS